MRLSSKIIIVLLLFNTLSIAELPNIDKIVKDAGQDWKKELVALCRSAREQVEGNPDEQLIYSCIVTSHFENAMADMGDSKEFTPELKVCLQNAFKAKEDFGKGFLIQNDYF